MRRGMRSTTLRLPSITNKQALSMATIPTRTTYASMHLSPLRLSLEMVSIQGTWHVVGLDLLAVEVRLSQVSATAPTATTRWVSNWQRPPGRLIALALQQN